MEDNLVGSFGLAGGLEMSDSGESGLALEGTQVFCDFGGVKLPPVVENHYTRDAKAGDDILPNKLSNISRSDGGNSLGFYPLAKVIYRDKKVITLTRGFGERSQYVHTLSSKR